jgi:hypothetical protein
MDPMSLVILIIATLAGLGLAAALAGAESRDGFDRSARAGRDGPTDPDGIPTHDGIPARDFTSVRPDMRPGVNGPSFR